MSTLGCFFFIYFTVYSRSRLIYGTGSTEQNRLKHGIIFTESKPKIRNNLTEHMHIEDLLVSFEIKKLVIFLLI